MATTKTTKAKTKAAKTKTARSKNVKAKTTKTKTAARKTNATPTKRRSQLDAALMVLARSKTPMSCTEMVGAMIKRKLWNSPNGKTPHATLYAAILREINAKGKDARFKKVDRGQFAARK